MIITLERFKREWGRLFGRNGRESLETSQKEVLKEQPEKGKAEQSAFSAFLQQEADRHEGNIQN